MRILLLAEWFDPEPAFKGLVFAKKLQELGHQVDVLTGIPNYPGGRVYAGYSIRLLQRETMSGVRVTRAALYPSHDASAIKRVATFVSFGITSFFTGLLAMHTPDVIYVNGPPVTAGVAGALIGMLRGVPFVFDIQDLWPDTLPATGMLNNRVALRIVNAICSWMYGRAAHIVVPAPGIRDRLIERGVPADKVTVIYNWCDESSVAPASHTHADGTTDTFDVMFAGQMGIVQALTAIIDAAEILQTEAPRVRIQLMGGGIEVERLKELVSTRRLTNVQFVPRVPMAEVGPRLAQADALLVHLKDDPLFRMAIPSKTQAYLAAGKPIVMAVAGDAATLVEESGAGICPAPENPRSIADAIKRLSELDERERDEMGERGRRFYHERLSLDAGARKFSRLFERLVRGEHRDAQQSARMSAAVPGASGPTEC